VCSTERRRLRGDLTAAFQYLKGDHEQEGDRLLTPADSDRTRGKGSKLEEGDAGEMWRKSFPQRAVRRWHCCPELWVPIPGDTQSHGRARRSRGAAGRRQGGARGCKGPSDPTRGSPMPAHRRQNPTRRQSHGPPVPRPLTPGAAPCPARYGSRSITAHLRLPAARSAPLAARPQPLRVLARGPLAAVHAAGQARHGRASEPS